MVARSFHGTRNISEAKLVWASSYWLTIYMAMADDQIILSSEVLPNGHLVFWESYVYIVIFSRHDTCTTGSLEILTGHVQKMGLSYDICV